MSVDAATAVVLAAGKGRRLAPLISRRSNSIVTNTNRPLLEHIVSLIGRGGSAI
ncbi:sugar phosphate nucleotidyltransferase [Halorubrum sp. N11]|uniref:sugar phosphate nucleotidyltransferase n=1 Tax=Halorubrum sp. N11 TaxID=3402276 RepID=UPI003EBC8F8E